MTRWSFSMWTISHTALWLTTCLTVGHSLWLFSGNPKLGRYNVDENGISVSGISSGGAMATQYHVALSSRLMGIGIMAGVPYGCAGAGGTQVCMSSPSAINTAALVTLAQSASALRTIDTTTHLQQDRVFVYHSPVDTVVNHVAGEKVVEFYQNYITNSANIETKFDLASAHGVPTMDYGSACGQLGQEYMMNCSYSAAFHLLRHIYGANIQEPTTSTQATGKLLKFDQSEFFYFSAPSVYSMDTVGYVYIPSGCVHKTTECKLHIAFHGCKQGRTYVGEAFVRHAGYNEVAELNNIIVLYPQVISSLTNPYGCWDWWGYTGIYYGTKQGFQITAVRRMMDKVIG